MLLKLPTKLLRLFFLLMEYFSSDNERITPVNDLLQNYSLKKEILHRFKEEKKQSKKTHDNNIKLTLSKRKNQFTRVFFPDLLFRAILK